MEPTDQDPPPPTDEEIALCAYRIWLQQGCPHGHDKEHWLKARQQLLPAKRNATPRIGALQEGASKDP
jgi:hypothetical protein